MPKDSNSIALTPQLCLSLLQVRHNTFIQCTMAADGVEARISVDRTTRQLTEAVHIEANGLYSDYDLFRCVPVANAFAQNVAHVSSMVFYIQQMARTLSEVSNINMLKNLMGTADVAGLMEGDTSDRVNEHKTRAKLQGAVSLLRSMKRLAAGNSQQATVHDHLEQMMVGVRRLIHFCDQEDHKAGGRILLYHLGFFEAATAFLTTVSKQFLRREDSAKLTTQSQYSQLRDLVSLTWQLIRHAVQGSEPAGIYMVDHALEIMEHHAPFGMHALSALVASFDNNSHLNKQLNSKDGVVLRERMCHTVFDLLHEYGRIPLLYKLLSNICICYADDGKITHFQRTARLVMDLVLASHYRCTKDREPVLVERRVCPSTNRLQVKTAEVPEETWLYVNEMAADESIHGHGFDHPAFFKNRQSANCDARPQIHFSTYKACLEMLAAICVPCNHRDLQMPVRRFHDDLSSLEVEKLPPVFTYEEVSAAAFDGHNSMHIRCLYLRILRRIFLPIDKRGGHQMLCWPRIEPTFLAEEGLKDIYDDASNDQNYRAVQHAAFVGVPFGIDDELWSSFKSSGSHSQQAERLNIVTGKLVALISALQAKLETGTEWDCQYLAYGHELLRMCTGLVPCLALEIRECLKKQMDVVFRVIAVHINNFKTPVDGEEVFVVQVCNLCVQLVTTNVEQEHVKTFVETMYDSHVIRDGVTAKQLFELVDQWPKQVESSAAVIYLLRSNSLAIRCAAIQLLEVTSGQHSKVTQRTAAVPCIFFLFLCLKQRSIDRSFCLRSFKIWFTSETGLKISWPSRTRRRR